MRGRKDVERSKGFRNILSKQLSEFLRSEARVLGDRTHGEGVDWVMAWNGEADLAIAHDYVPGLIRPAHIPDSP